jgi:hypothetical protein
MFYPKQAIFYLHLYYFDEIYLNLDIIPIAFFRIILMMPCYLTLTYLSILVLVNMFGLLHIVRKENPCGRDLWGKGFLPQCSLHYILLTRRYLEATIHMYQTAAALG